MAPKIESQILELHGVFRVESKIFFGGKTLIKHKNCKTKKEAMRYVVICEIDLTTEYLPYLSEKMNNRLGKNHADAWFVKQIIEEGNQGALMDFPKAILKLEDDLKVRMPMVHRNLPLHLHQKCYLIQHEIRFLIDMGYRLQKMIRRLMALKEQMKEAA
jgi:hypothetical protein